MMFLFVSSRGIIKYDFLKFQTYSNETIFFHSVFFFGIAVSVALLERVMEISLEKKLTK